MAFAGIEAGGDPVIEELVFFGSDIQVVFDGFGILHAVGKQAGDLDLPAFCFGAYVVLVADGHGSGGFHGGAAQFYLSAVAGGRRLRSGFDDADEGTTYFYARPGLKSENP